MFQFLHPSTFLASFIDDVAEILPEISHFYVDRTDELVCLSAKSGLPLHQGDRKLPTHLLH